MSNWSILLKLWHNGEACSLDAIITSFLTDLRACSITPNWVKSRNSFFFKKQARKLLLENTEQRIWVGDKQRAGGDKEVHRCCAPEHRVAFSVCLREHMLAENLAPRWGRLVNSIVTESRIPPEPYREFALYFHLSLDAGCGIDLLFYVASYVRKRSRFDVVLWEYF